ncbi:restin homolog [Lucilia cuprina]|uniref:restin homolog n=1 Tax=Lucilia cuprina TaxID=7375 RepID=UPI001F05C500|nr:restin homolog [Lucilia cuprina]
MRMTTMKFRQLIDMAIGFPEPGHVNFSALHCLLTCIAEKLGITDEMIEYCNNETETVCFCNKASNYELLQKPRLLGGTNPNEEKSNSEQKELSTESNAATLNESLMSEEIPIVSETLPKNTEEQISGQKHVIEVLSPTNSKTSIKSLPKPITSQLSVHKLKERISKIEMTMQQISLSKEFTLGIAIMKDQLEFVMEQLLLLTFLTLSKKPDFHQIQKLHSMAQTLREFKKENVYIDGSNRIQFPSVQSLNWQSSGLQLNEVLSENDLLEAQNIGFQPDAIIAQTATFQDELNGHLCYSPEKLLDQLMELKSEFCLLTNKVNEVSSRLLQQESQRTFSLISEIQEQMRDHKITTINLKETQSRIEARISNNQNSIENMKKIIEDVMVEKVDKTELEIQLANKVDYDQLKRKASLDQLQELHCRVDNQISEILRQINENEKQFSKTVDNLNDTLGFASIEGILKTFKENITKDVQELHTLLKNYIDSTNDDCAAAGARIKVLQDLACLSCDTNCIMRTMEKAKVAKLPSAHASNILSPLITYELGSIRKSGIIGYYRKDDFPHSTNAWLERQSNGMTDLKQCIPRHAGGEHTTYNAKERVKKMMSYRK